MSERNKERTLVAIIILYLILMLFKTCETNSVINDKYEEANDKIAEFKVRILKDSSTIVTQIQNIETSKKKLESIGLSDVKEVVKIKYKYVYKTQIQLDTISITDSCYKYGSYLKLPLCFSKKDKWNSIDGSISRFGVMEFDSIASFGSITYAVGDTLRKGIINRLFQKTDKVVRLKVDNPSIIISDFSNIYIKDEPKWHKRPMLYFILGVTAGVLLNTAVNKQSSP